MGRPGGFWLLPEGVASPEPRQPFSAAEPLFCEHCQQLCDFAYCCRSVMAARGAKRNALSRIVRSNGHPMAFAVCLFGRCPGLYGRRSTSRVAYFFVNHLPAVLKDSRLLIGGPACSNRTIRDTLPAGGRTRRGVTGSNRTIRDTLRSRAACSGLPRPPHPSGRRCPPPSVSEAC